jgi:hypothetical protein
MIIVLLFAMMPLMILLPNLFNRVPAFSYFVRELSLPLTYEISGRVNVVYSDKENSNNCGEHRVAGTVEVFVGGYATMTDENGNFSLRFSSPHINEFFAIIRYMPHSGNPIHEYELIVIQQGETRIAREFTIYV